MHDRLEHMKETLMCAVEMQLCELGEVDTKELGEAIDMIKDLEEAIYYCTVTEAMNGPAAQMKKDDHYQEYDNGRMYYDGGHSSSNGRNYNTSSRNSMYIKSLFILSLPSKSLGALPLRICKPN